MTHNWPGRLPQAVQDIQQATQLDLAWRRAGGPGRVTSRAAQDPRLVRSRVPRHRGELAKTRWE